MGKKFNKLAGKVEREYEREGVSRKKAEEWGKATAGKVWREKQCIHCGSKGHHSDACAYKPNIHKLL